MNIFSGKLYVALVSNLCLKRQNTLHKKLYKNAQEIPSTAKVAGHRINGVQSRIRPQEIPTLSSFLPGGGDGPCLRIQSWQKILFFKYSFYSLRFRPSLLSQQAYVSQSGSRCCLQIPASGKWSLCFTHIQAHTYVSAEAFCACHQPYPACPNHDCFTAEFCTQCKLNQ